MARPSGQANQGSVGDLAGETSDEARQGPGPRNLVFESPLENGRARPLVEVRVDALELE